MVARARLAKSESATCAFAQAPQPACWLLAAGCCTHSLSRLVCSFGNLFPPPPLDAGVPNHCGPDCQPSTLRTVPGLDVPWTAVHTTTRRLDLCSPPPPSRRAAPPSPFPSQECIRPRRQRCTWPVPVELSQSRCASHQFQSRDGRGVKHGLRSLPIQNDAVDWLRDGKEDEAEEQTSCLPSPPRRTRSASRTSSSTSRSCISRQVLCRRLQTRPVTF